MSTTLTPSLSTALTTPTTQTVPPEHFRFIPGYANLSNQTNITHLLALNITNITNPLLVNGVFPTRLGDAAISPINSTTRRRNEIPARDPMNATFFIDEEFESVFTELQTLFLACVATFIPLIISLFAGFGIRMLWRKYRRYRDCNNYDVDVLHHEESSEPLARPLCSHLLNTEQIRSSHTHLSITADEEICEATPSSIVNGTTHSTSHSSTNGSIITMTLKNNHLIVETEERNDIEKDGRETTMKYSPGARNGVFVVEVQQGCRRSPGRTMSPQCPQRDGFSTSNERAVIHNPPERYSEDEYDEGDENSYYVTSSTPSRETLLQIQAQTGLTQSDLSISSSSHSYRYGGQNVYGEGGMGYADYNGYACEDPPTHLAVTSHPIKPKIISEVLKNQNVENAASEDEAVHLEQEQLGNGTLYVENDCLKSKEKLDNSEIRPENEANPEHVNLEETNEEVTDA